MIELVELTKRYAGRVAVDGLSLSVEPGELVPWTMTKAQADKLMARNAIEPVGKKAKADAD